MVAAHRLFRCPRMELAAIAVPPAISVGAVESDSGGNFAAKSQAEGPSLIRHSASAK